MNMSVRESASPSAQGATASSTNSTSATLASTLVAQACDAKGGLDARSLGQDIRQFAEHDPAFARQTLEAVGNQLFEAGHLGDADHRLWPCRRDGPPAAPGPGLTCHDLAGRHDTRVAAGAGIVKPRHQR